MTVIYHQPSVCHLTRTYVMKWRHPLVHNFHATCNAWHCCSLSVYVSGILRVFQIVGFSILFFPWKIVKYVTGYHFLHAMIPFPVCVNCQRHIRLTIYRVCGAFYQCLYNTTLTISHNSHCIKGVFYKMCLCVSCMGVIYDIVPSC